MTRIRVLLADDHALFRRGMARILGREKAFTVVGEARDADEALAKAAALEPDVVLMDLSMPGASGLEATRRIRHAVPAAKIVILTVSDEQRQVFDAIKAGAHGYLVKSAKPGELFDTLRNVVAGDAFVPPRLAARIIEEFTGERGAGAAARGARRKSDGLSPREHDVLAQLTLGAANREIAARLGISENTVKSHLKRIMEKLRLENRVQLARYALEEGRSSTSPAQ